MTGKSSCILQSMNNLSYMHGKYKISNPPGKQETMDIGVLKFMLDADTQSKLEHETDVHKDTKRHRWFKEEFETNPYIV